MLYLVRTLNGFRVTTNQQQAIQELHETAQLVKDRRGIDRANDFQNYEEAYARGEI